MENEIKVGDYVRTKQGHIVKVSGETNIFNCDDKEYIDISSLPFEEEIVKHSKNIIDIIESEDAINIKTGLYSSFMNFIVDEDELIYIKSQIEAGFWIIDEIYTKEMMESISYKVERKD